MGRCIALKKDLERCSNDTQKDSLFCRRHRWWGPATIFGVIVAVTTIGANVSTMLGTPVFKTATPTPTETPIPTLTATFTPTPTLTSSPMPTETSTEVVLYAPVIDSIDFPDSIVCDGRRYDVPIRFHDLDGDAHRIQWELRFTKKNTPLYTTAKEFVMDSQTQASGATFYDFIQWHVSGDEVIIRVHIEDRSKQSGYMDFEFKCSN